MSTDIGPMLGKLADIEGRYQELNRLLALPELATDYEKLQAYAKERASLEALVIKYREYRKAHRDLEEARAILEGGADEELAALARGEAEALIARLEGLAQEIKVALLPKDPNDSKDVIVEVRAGTGGEEAALFAADLYRMYTRYALSRGWQVEVMDASKSEAGGFKEMVFEVRGKRAYSRLKHESGVHRVQRVPTTEASGRIHTSTATVAVLPEADEVEVHIDPDDLRIDIFHAGGHGGQNVNKVATAVRVVHIPTGTVAVCQDERSQLKNKTKALAVLRARLFEKERLKQESEITAARRSQVGSAERAEKIRTYNFPQDRVTDHRIGITLHNLSAILEGDLDGLLEALAAHEQGQRLEAQLA